MHRQLRRLAAPLILANLSVPLLGMVDTAVVGHLEDPEPLGAVAIGATLFGFLYWGFGFLRMGTTGLTAQEVGGGGAVELVLLRGLLLAGLIGGGLVALQGLLGRIGLDLLAPGPEVRPLAETYFAIRIASAPAALIHYVVAGWFLGRENGRVPLLLMVLVNGLNAALDAVLVLGFGLGVAGVATASVVAEYVAAGLGLFLVARAGGLARPVAGWRAVGDGAALRRMVAVNRDLFIRTLVLLGAFAFFTRQGAAQGEVILAANAVLMNFQTLMAYALDGFAHATEALTGRTVGAGDRDGLRRAVAAAAQWSVGLAAGFAAAYLLAGEYLIAMLTGIPEVREAAATYLPWAAAAPLVAVAGFLFDGVFIGATWTRELRNAMLVVVFGIYLPAWWLLMPAFGNHGLWAAMILFLLARGVALGLLWPRRLAGVGAG
ncbi:MATE family efflux transporter [Thiohalospira sp.]|uniref:MATE family efflux transporter n=1 Tax=Thiohalospira sp. TaxID=3080549 RepID=UPI0039811410